LSNAKVLRAVEKRLDAKLKAQTCDALSEYFSLSKCGGVANEIKKCKSPANVRDNVEYGIRTCIHPKIGPRVDPTTWSFTPQSKKARLLEHKGIDLLNKTLENGGFPTVDKGALLKRMRVEDRDFEKDAQQRRRKK
jgi:hypothetical protein